MWNQIDKTREEAYERENGGAETIKQIKVIEEHVDLLERNQNGLLK